MMCVTIGERLKQIREAAIAKGMRLLSEDEVLEEVRRRREGVTADANSLYKLNEDNHVWSGSMPDGAV